jgi:ribosomal-protein-serine acetyltransferase
MNTATLKRKNLNKLHIMTIEIDQEIKLTQLEQSDAKDIFETIDSQRDYLGKWLPFVAFTRDISDSEQYVNSVVNAPEERFEYVFAIRKGDRFVGLIGFKDTDKTNKKTEIGYWLSEKYQKQGIVTKSVDRLCDFAFHQLGINRIQIKCAVGNQSSSNIPKRLGFRFEGIERQGELLTGGFFTDLEIYSKLKSDK